jgi:hypothetical protein
VQCQLVRPTPTSRSQRRGTRKPFEVTRWVIRGTSVEHLFKTRGERYSQSNAALPCAAVPKVTLTTIYGAGDGKSGGGSVELSMP